VNRSYRLWWQWLWSWSAIRSIRQKWWYVRPTYGHQILESILHQ